MCGIVAIYAHSDQAPPVDRGEVRAVRDQMALRGPDGLGEWFSDDGRVGLGHRRLSIIDLSDAGQQPMASADGRLQLVFNGEIYNYRALREELVGQGHTFRSSSDTEVILHLYEEVGAALVDRLRGMFAFALWDARCRRMLLARDPFGIKPLYYTRDGGTVRVASQVKALLAGGAVSRDPDPGGAVGFLLWGSVPEPHTLYREVACLPAGSTLEVGPDGPGPARSYWSPARVYDGRAAAPPQGEALPAGEQIRRGLLESVRHHLEADVPVGVFLSAGIDSNVLLALVCEGRKDAAERVQTVTLAFSEFKGTHRDESALAQRTARQYGARHTPVYLSRQDFAALLEPILAAMDQPSIDGVNTYLVSKAAADCGLKVAISGLGGDELFGGYPAFRTLPRLARWLSPLSRRRLALALLRRAAEHLPLGRRAPKLRGLLRLPDGVAAHYFVQRGLFMPWELSGLLDDELVAEGLRLHDPVAYVRRRLPGPGSALFGQVAALEQSVYMRNQLLRDSDWAGMANSLEIRLPLVDRTLAEQVGALGQQSFGRLGGPKGVLASAARPPLPQELVRRPKSGFGVPMQKWTADLDPGGGLLSSAAGDTWPRRWSRYLAARAGLVGGTAPGVTGQ